MATRQYIGARYVPKFFENPDGSNNWLNGVAYEPLTIVTYANTSYTSKIPVPATIGSPNDNPTYWVSTGTGGSGVGGSEINEIKQQINNINTEINNIENEISNIDTKIDNIKEKRKYIIIMDSWGDPTFTSNYEVIKKTMEFAGVPTENYFYRAHAGGSFSGSGNLNLLTDITELAGTIANKDEITDIYVFSGANDYQATDNTTAIKTGINNFTKYCKQNFVNAKVKIGAVSNGIQGEYNKAAGIVVNAYMDCSLYNAIYLDNSEYIFRRYKDYDSTLTHPNASGAEYLAKQLSVLIRKDRIDVYRRITVNMTTNDSNISMVGTYVPMEMVQHNGSVQLFGMVSNGFLIRYQYSTLKTSYSINDNFTLDDCFMFSQNTVPKIFPVNCQAGEPSKWLNCSGSMFVLGFNRPQSKPGVPVNIQAYAESTTTGIKFVNLFPAGSCLIF